MSVGAAIAPSERDIASIRILRLAVGIALALVFSQSVNWSGAFLAPVLVSVILTLPLPAPSLIAGLRFVAVLTGSLLVGLMLVPMLNNQPAAGVLLVLLVLFSCFYYGAKGGSPILTMFLLIGVTVVPAIGSESVDASLAITSGLALAAVVAVLFVWISFALFPDSQVLSRPGPKAQQPPAANIAARSALRSTIIVAPVFLWLLMSSETAAYAIALVKVASMGQQVSMEGTKAAGRDLIMSTLIGGVAAVIIWNLLQIWPVLVIYGLLFLLCGLIIGPHIFSGQSLAQRGPMWSYALLTMMIIIVPAALDPAGGDDAQVRIADRILMFLLATAYAVGAVYIFDRFWPGRTGSKG